MKKICEFCNKEYDWEEGQLNWGKDGPKKGGGSVRSDKFCCFECGCKSKQQKIWNTYFIKTGYHHPNSNPKSQKLRKLRYKKKTGYDNQSQDPKVIEKRKLSYLKKTGYIHPSYNPVAKDKRIKTYKEKTGYNSALANPEVRNKSKLLYKEKTGYEYALQNPKIKEKVKKTNIEKYGAKTYAESIFWKDKINNVDWQNNRKQKEYETKKKNNSFNSSKPEEEIYNLLLQKYPDTVRQHRSDLYPFNCDFYIPSLDLYIEYQGTWTHGNHPFNKDNEEDLKILEKWKNKNTKFYNNAIKVWTIKDPLKRKIAKENNLNCIEFFNMKEFLEWYNKGDFNEKN